MASSERAAVGDGILTAKNQTPPDSALEARVKRSRGTKVAQVVMSLHGIRTRGRDDPCDTRPEHGHPHHPA